jgi:hypothetical protein
LKRERRHKPNALDALHAAFAESCAPGWDGYAAASASCESYLRAKRFIKALPANFLAPEVAVDPDGEVSLEWYCPTGRVFSVSIGANDGLTYAGIVFGFVFSGGFKPDFANTGFSPSMGLSVACPRVRQPRG